MVTGSGKARVTILEHARARLQEDRTALTQQVVELLIQRRKLPPEDHDAHTALSIQIEALNSRIQEANEDAQEFLRRLTRL
ncbi:MAG: hypothetical protein NVSMB31_16540 [Vulcanimicrobiaceae bacterium]